MSRGGVKRISVLLVAVSLFASGVVFGNLNTAEPSFADIDMTRTSVPMTYNYGPSGSRINNLIGSYGEQFIYASAFWGQLNGGGTALSNYAVINYAKQFNDLKDSINTLTSAVQSIPTTITASASASSNGGGSSSEQLPTITVCENTNFDVVVGYYDDMISGSSPGGECTATNSVVGDGVVQLRGRFATKGTYQVLISGRKFIVKVIEAPKPNAVTVILN